MILLRNVMSETLWLIGKAFIKGEVGSIIGGKLSYVVSWKLALLSFFSTRFGIAEVVSFFDGWFILLRMVRFASGVLTFTNSPVSDDSATVGLSRAPTASAHRYMPSKGNQVHNNELKAVYVKVIWLFINKVDYKPFCGC